MTDPNTNISKSRRIMHIMSAGFGFLAFFVIIKGFFDINKKMNNKVYFDRVVQTSRDTAHIDADANFFIVYPYSSLKRDYKKHDWYLTEGGVWFAVKDSLVLHTPGGKLTIYSAEGYVLADRYPEIFLKRGKVEFANKTLKGKGLMYNDIEKTVDTIDASTPPPPFIISDDSVESKKIRRFFPGAKLDGRLPVAKVNRR